MVCLEIPILFGENGRLVPISAPFQMCPVRRREAINQKASHTKVVKQCDISMQHKNSKHYKINLNDILCATNLI